MHFAPQPVPHGLGQHEEGEGQEMQRRQDMWHALEVVQQTPEFSQPAQRVENLARAVLALRRVLFHQREVQRHTLPFLLAQITWAWLPAHPSQMGLFLLRQGQSQCMTGMNKSAEHFDLASAMSKSNLAVFAPGDARFFKVHLEATRKKFIEAQKSDFQVMAQTQ
jgi:hypothetical protein